jgi:hypothetical protein
MRRMNWARFPLMLLIVAATAVTAALLATLATSWAEPSVRRASVVAASVAVSMVVSRRLSPWVLAAGNPAQ